MLSRKAKEAKVAEPRPTDLSSQTKREMLTSLTRSGIASLFGLKDGIQGINVSNRRQCVGPHEIAPSVWNSRYLQVGKLIQLSKALLVDMILGNCLQDTAGTVHFVCLGDYNQYACLSAVTNAPWPAT